MEREYYRAVDRKDTIVVKTRGKMRLDMFAKGADGWRETEFDHAYEREIYFGEGNNCLFRMTEEEAAALLIECAAPALEH